MAAPVSDAPLWTTVAWGTTRQRLPLRTAAKPEVRSTERNSSHTPLRLSGSAETTLTWPCTCGSSTRVRPVMRLTCSATSLMSAPRMLMTTSCMATGAGATVWAMEAVPTGPAARLRASSLVVVRRKNFVTPGS